MPRKPKDWELTPKQAATVTANIGLALAYAKKHHRRHRMAFDDAVSACYLALCRAVHLHDPDRGTLGTLAYTSMERSMRREASRDAPIYVPRDNQAGPRRHSPARKAQAEMVRGMRRVGGGYLYALPVPREADPAAADLASQVLGRLDPERRDLVERVVMRGESGAKLAVEWGCSRQAVNQAKKSVLAEMRDMVGVGP